MKHYVFFNDDYANCGGIGLKECETKQKATKFIEERLKHGESSRKSIDNYTVIYGRKAVLKTVEVATKVEIDV